MPTLTLRRLDPHPMKPQIRSNGTSQPKCWILAWRMPPSLRFHRCPFRNRGRSIPLTQCQYCSSAPMFRPTYLPRARIAVHRPDHLTPPSAHSPHHPRVPKHGSIAPQRQRRRIVNLAIDAHRAEKFRQMTYERRTYIDTLRLIPKTACAAKRTVAGLCTITTGV